MKEKNKQEATESSTEQQQKKLQVNKENEKWAAELIVANKELAFQNEEKDKRAAELIIANKELAFQNEEKDKRAAELIIANKELAFQNDEKEKRAAELIIANKELAFQNEEKEKRAAELIIAKEELVFQNSEKDNQSKRTFALKEQNLELEMQKKQLDEASQLKSAFLSNMSHELRTPLNAIVGFSELALKTSLTEKQHNYLSKIKISSQTLLGLVSDILDLSKIEAGKMELEMADFYLEEVLQQIINQFGNKSQEKGLKLTIITETNVPKRIKGDELRLGQILSNLTSNAVKFSKNGEIVIHVELLENDEESAKLQFSIKDTGIGLTEKQAKTLFQPFTQADTSTTRIYGGTGLGLSISRELVSMMNGDIWVESTEGVGSIFYFTVITKTANEMRFSQYRKSVEKWGLRILVVDDKEDSREILGSMLAEMPLEVTMTTSGKEAIAILEKTNENNRYDLVIMDWKMPEMDGIEASLRIKKLFKKDDAPAIILLTAYATEGLQERADQIGLEESILYKPITPSLLFNAIIHVCDKAGLDRTFTATEKKDDSTYLSKLLNTRVLLVEDNEINREVATEILEVSGLKVTIAKNGREAVVIMKASPIDIILMDIQMPIMDGYAATIEIRKDKAFNDVPIIAMTANALPNDRIKCMQAGMNDYVSKPIDTNELLRKIAQWVKREPGIVEKPMLETSTHQAAEEQAFIISEKMIDKLVGIDVETGLSRLGGNQTLFYKLLIKFHKNHKKAIKEIRNALDLNDKKTAEIIAHTLKGVAGNIGAQSVFLNAGALEAELKLKTRMDAEPLLKQLDQALEQVFSSISFLEKEMDDTVSITLKTVKAELLKPILEELKILLQENNMDAVECSEAIVTHTKNTPMAQKAIELNDSINQYDFVCALGIMSELLNNVRESEKDGDI